MRTSEPLDEDVEVDITSVDPPAAFYSRFELVFQRFFCNFWFNSPFLAFLSSPILLILKDVFFSDEDITEDCMWYLPVSVEIEDPDDSFSSSTAAPDSRSKKDGVFFCILLPDFWEVFLNKCLNSILKSFVLLGGLD